MDILNIHTRLQDTIFSIFSSIQPKILLFFLTIPAQVNICTDMFAVAPGLF